MAEIIKSSNKFNKAFGEVEIDYEPQVEIYVDAECTILWNGKFKA